MPENPIIDNNGACRKTPKSQSIQGGMPENPEINKKFMGMPENPKIHSLGVKLKLVKLSL